MRSEINLEKLENLTILKKEFKDFSHEIYNILLFSSTFCLLQSNVNSRNVITGVNLLSCRRMSSRKYTTERMQNKHMKPHFALCILVY